jgi:hypothetical protein
MYLPMVFLYYNVRLFTMIKQLCLIVIVAIGLIILIPGTNVAAKSNPHHSNFIAGKGFGIGAIMKFKQHKDNPTQIHHGKR